MYLQQSITYSDLTKIKSYIILNFSFGHQFTNRLEKENNCEQIKGFVNSSRRIHRARLQLPAKQSISCSTPANRPSIIIRVAKPICHKH